MNQAAKVVMFNVRSRAPRVRGARSRTWYPESALHALTGGRTRLVISDYFLNEDGFGKVSTAEGDHKIRRPRTHDDLILDLVFNSISTARLARTARPHGVAIR